MKLNNTALSLSARINTSGLTFPAAVLLLVFLFSCKVSPPPIDQHVEDDIEYQLVFDSIDRQADLSLEVSRRLVHLGEFYPQEKLYIHTDKSHYLPGETIWFKLYLTDASSHQASPWSRIVYVELADTAGMVAGRRYIGITGGTGHGDFQLDPEFEPGTWVLRGHTNYMRNYSSSPLFSMELRVIDAYPGRFGLTGSRQAAAPGREPKLAPLPAGIPDDVPEHPDTPATKAHPDNAVKDHSTTTAKEDPDASSVLSDTAVTKAHPDTAAMTQISTTEEGPEAPPDTPATTPLTTAIPPDDLDVRFFPEGGDLVAGLSTVVAVKSTIACGTGIELQGNVYDDLGNHVAGFVTGHFGLGRFEFTPIAGRLYHAGVETADTTHSFDLPGVKETGYTLQVNNSMPDEALVRIETNLDRGLSNAFLIGHIRGEIFCLEKLPEGSMAIINIDKTEFPAGIVHLTLFSAEGMPVAERLIFINDKEPQARLEVVKSAEIYDHREKVEMELELTDSNGNPLKGDFSVSVTDSYVVPSHHDRHNIETWLLLSSDLPGTIGNPGYFFDPGNADRHQLLDLLMTTNGWRRFRWDDLIAGRYPYLRYPAGTGHIIDGRVSLINQHDVPVRAKVMLSALGDEFFASSQITGEDGRFLFDDIELYDTTVLVLQGSFYRERRAQRMQRRGVDDTFTPGGENRVALHLEEPDIVQHEVDIAAATAAEEVLRAYIEDSMKDPLLSHLEDIWHLEIEEVEIRRRRPRVRTTFDRAIHGTPFRMMDRIIPDEYPFTHTYHNTWEFIRAMKPGLIIDDGPPRFTSGPTSLFNPMGTLVLLNGTEIRYDIINTLPVETISFIDMIRPPQTTIYRRGVDLVIAIYTKTLEDYRDAATGPPGLLSFEFPGYYRAREFYSPMYDRPGPHHDQPDYRTTLFWEPEVKPGEDGRAKVSFFTSDKASVYRIIIEGMTQTGIPVVKTKELWVQDRKD